MRREFGKSSRALIEAVEETVDASETTISRPPASECWLLRLLLETDDHVEWIGEHLEMEWLTHPTVRAIITAARLGRWGIWPDRGTGLAGVVVAIGKFGMAKSYHRNSF